MVRQSRALDPFFKPKPPGAWDPQNAQSTGPYNAVEILYFGIVDHYLGHSTFFFPDLFSLAVHSSGDTYSWALYFGGPDV